MSIYQIGRDIQDILRRLDQLEGAEFPREQSNPFPDIGKAPDQFQSVDEEDIKELEAQDKGEGLLAVNWNAPFKYPRTWDSGSRGNLFVYGTARANKDNGVCTITINAGDGSVDNSDRASRFMEAYFAFGYRNPYRKGKLMVRADYYINRVTLKDRIYDEIGKSAINFTDFQRVSIDAYKKVGDESVKFGSRASDLQIPCNWKYREGRGDKVCDRSRRDVPTSLELVSDNELDKGQTAYIYVGIWSGLSLWTNDYGYQTYNACNVRLDNVTARIIAI